MGLPKLRIKICMGGPSHSRTGKNTQVLGNNNILFIKWEGNNSNGQLCQEHYLKGKVRYGRHGKQP